MNVFLLIIVVLLLRYLEKIYVLLKRRFVKTTFTFSQSCKMHLEGLYEFAVILAEEILILFYEFSHRNFDYVIVKRCHSKMVPPKAGQPA